MATVSNPRGQTFEEARLSFEDVQAALEKGTVIFNSAGAHIPKLAGPALAYTDASVGDHFGRRRCVIHSSCLSP